MPEVYLGLGSNKTPDHHLSLAIEQLAANFGAIEVSPIYRSKAVGFLGDDFLNAVVRIQTSLSVGDLKRFMTELEDACGRDRSQPKFSDRVLDIDILLYDDYHGVFDGLTLPREEIGHYAHVLRPLADIAPTLIAPDHGQTYQTLWDAFEGDRSLILHTLDSRTK